ncbi:MAG: hypothetical protein BRC33_11250 [Cyanobacteria bacterium SW_9_44_58]|nr:MAG: hypothetical protein BRC33_11250 [Cyanobacteria bacterium SW_9_44_58]
MTSNNQRNCLSPNEPLIKLVSRNSKHKQQFQQTWPENLSIFGLIKPHGKHFKKKAQANGVTMSDLIKNWISEYIAEDAVTTHRQYQNDQKLWERLKALEEKVDSLPEESASVNQETEQKLEQYIQYVDQRIDTLERVVITPLKEDFQGLKKSWEALFNQVRTLEDNFTQLKKNLEIFQQKTQQQMARMTQFINQKLKDMKQSNQD